MNGVEIFFLILLLSASLSLMYGEKDISDSEDSIAQEKLLGRVMFVLILIWVYVQLEWLFWIGIIIFIFWRVQRFWREIDEKNAKEYINTQLQLEEEKNRQNNLKKLYTEKLKELENIDEKNKQLQEEITILKPIVSSLSIYDDDFLEQQPKVLEYIEEVINLGRI